MDVCYPFFLAAGKLPVGIGAAAALAAVAVIVDAGGQRARTPTGREYLPFPRHNPDLWKVRVLDVLQTHNKVESGISNTIPWMTNLNPLQLEQEWRPMSFNFICLWNISVVTDVISEFRFCPNLWDGLQGHLWASQVVNLIIPALAQGHATTSFIVEVCNPDPGAKEWLPKDWRALHSSHGQGPSHLYCILLKLCRFPTLSYFAFVNILSGILKEDLATAFSIASISCEYRIQVMGWSSF